MGYMKDWRAKRLDSLSALRDLPAVVGHWDASKTPFASGANVDQLTDLSGYNNDLLPIGTGFPTVAVRGSNKVIRATTAVGLANPAFGMGSAAGVLAPTSGYAQPNTITSVFSAKTGSSVAGTARKIVSGSQASTRQDVVIDTTSAIALGAGGGTIGAGLTKVDGNLHVVTAVFAPASFMIVLDGQLLTTGATQSQGSAAFGGIGWGTTPVGGSYLDGDLGELIVQNTSMGLTQIVALHASLAGKWGITMPDRADQANGPWVDGTQTNGQAYRLFPPAPAKRAATNPLVVFTHAFTQNQQITPAFWAYPFVHAALQRGFTVAASNQHADNWGNTNSINDITDLISTVNAKYPVGDVILLPGSMGGLSASLAAAAGIANLKGVYSLDAVYSLAWAYEQSGFRAAITTAYSITAGTLSGATTAGATSLPTTASFPTIGTQLTVGAGTANTEVVTTTGASTGTAVAVTATTKTHGAGDVVSDFPTKSAGHNPVALSGASLAALKALRWKILSVPTGSGADTQVDPAFNSDAMATLLAGATSVVQTRHNNGHLSPAGVDPADFVAFLASCGH